MPPNKRNQKEAVNPNGITTHDRIEMLRNPWIDQKTARDIKEQLMLADQKSFSEEDYQFMLHN